MAAQCCVVGGTRAAGQAYKHWGAHRVPHLQVNHVEGVATVIETTEGGGASGPRHAIRQLPRPKARCIPTGHDGLVCTVRGHDSMMAVRAGQASCRPVSKKTAGRAHDVLSAMLMEGAPAAYTSSSSSVRYLPVP